MGIEWCPNVIPNIDVPPDNRIIPELGNEKIIKHLNSIQSDFFRSELKSVISDIRRAGTIHIHSSSMMVNLNNIIDNGLIFLPILECSSVEGFAHKFYEPKQGEPRDVFGVMTKKLSHARAFREAFNSNDHDFVGRMLGYPTCCINFFKNTWSYIIDPVWQWAYNSPHKVIDSNTVEVTGYPECNMLLRYFNLRTTPHIVCSSKCESSRKLAMKLKPLTPTFDSLIDILSKDMIWDGYKGEAVVKTDGFMGIGNSTPYSQKLVIKWSL